MSLTIFAVKGIPEVQKGDSLPALILNACKENGINLLDEDIFVIAQKVVSKAEGCVFKEKEIKPSAFAEQVSAYTGHTPAYTELVLKNTKRIVRMAQNLIIVQTHTGLVMANAGVDASNAGGPDRYVALPDDPDRSAATVRAELELATGRRFAVIISDTFGRPWRKGQVNVAIGSSGIAPFADYRGLSDNDGREMKATCIAAADELASAAELVSGKTGKHPVIIIRGYPFAPSDETARSIVREEQEDLFR